MKKFKKLIPAFCMLLVSAIMLGSSTFAWFSMNETVTASGMQVTAKSNSTFLLIVAEDKAGNNITVESNMKTSVDAAPPANKNLYPAAFFKTVTADSTIGSTEAGKIVGKDSIAAGDTNVWVTANNTNRNDANNSVTNIKKLNSADESFKNYVAEYKVWLTLAKDSENVSKYIKITGADNEEAKYVVKIGTDYILNGKTTSTVQNLTSSSTIEVSILVYVDGTNANVKSETNLADIGGTISVTFDLVDAVIE